MNVNAFLSSANVEIHFAGRKVGQMQNLVINSDFGVRRIDSVFQSNSSGFVRGVSHHDIKASKAFVSLSSVFGGEAEWNTLLDQVTKGVSVMNQGGSLGDLGGLGNLFKIPDADIQKALGTLDLLKSGSGLLTALSGSPLKVSVGSSSGPDIQKLNEKVDDFSKSPNASLGDILSDLEFEIVIKSNMDNLTDSGGLANIGSGGVLFTLSRCKVVSRVMTISVGNVIIMEDMNIFARSMSDNFVSRTKA